VLKKFNEGVEKVAGIGLVVFMAVMAITIPITVFGRYILRNTPTWTDETALFSLVWASMLGAAVGLRKGYQIGIRSLVEKAPKALSITMQSVGYLFMFVLFGVLITYGMKQTITNMRQLSPAMQIPMGIPYLALPLGFFCMFLFTLEEALGFLADMRSKKEA
ncbi:MAG: TRAP transporter small permease, partial [Rectinema subterraneum]|uniref:TRAP transporter small permease n=1 Tax=Rectinema subterraneum TaxID=2653714 RepID=UPI003C7B3CFE